jgi:hypothetical protein
MISVSSSMLAAEGIGGGEISGDVPPAHNGHTIRQPTAAAPMPQCGRRCFDASKNPLASLFTPPPYRL